MSDDSNEQANKGEDDSPETIDDSKRLKSELFRKLSDFEGVISNLERLKSDLSVLQDKVKDVTDKLEKSDTYLVTVLGVFTAIMVTFVGAFAFSSSVFQNMEQSDIHRLIFVILCTAVFIASILRWLFDFLLKISGKETKDSTWWWLLIIFLLLILLACDFCEYRMETYFHVLKY